MIAMNPVIVLALLGWAVALGAVCVAVDQQRMLKRAWSREDWYREQLLKACELLAHPAPMLKQDISIDRGINLPHVES